jgi:hypothetical protein
VDREVFVTPLKIREGYLAAHRKIMDDEKEIAEPLKDSRN